MIILTQAWDEEITLDAAADNAPTMFGDSAAAAAECACAIDCGWLAVSATKHMIKSSSWLTTLANSRSAHMRS